MSCAGPILPTSSTTSCTFYSTPTAEKAFFCSLSKSPFARETRTWQLRNLPSTFNSLKEQWSLWSCQPSFLIVQPFYSSTLQRLVLLGCVRKILQ